MELKSSCKTCYSKKTRCDRKFPCGQCTRSDTRCEARRRKPRTTGQNEPQFWNRLSRLENIVKTLGDEIESIGPNNHHISSATPNSNTVSSVQDHSEHDAIVRLPARNDGFIGHSLWASLATEVHALRDALQEDRGSLDSDDAKGAHSSSLGYTEPNDSFDSVFFSPGQSLLPLEAQMEPDERIRPILCDFYCENVDRVCKIFHAPTLRTFLNDRTSYQGKDYSTSGNTALRATIWFAAINSLADSQCLLLLGKPKLDQTMRYKRLAEISLGQADLLNTTDLATLQALTIYIAALRSIDRSRRCWTLIATAVRVARGMNLHLEEPSRSIFETELRRRLWHLLRLLDLFCAFDRGSEPLIRPSSYTTLLPLNVNDCDFDEVSTDLREPQQSMLTEMSFGRIAFDAIDVWQRLATANIPPSDEDVWQQRLQIVWDHGQHARQNYLRLCDLSDPFHRFTQTVCRFTVCSLMLQAVRPEQSHISATPPRADNPQVLRIAVNCLKIGEEMQTDPESEKWRWMIWLQWRALVVALAGLCTIRDTSLASEAWVWVEAAYARYPGNIADASGGMLWRPLVRLYQKAKMFKEHAAPLLDAAFPPQSNQPPTSRSNTTEMDVWEVDALHFIEGLPQFDLNNLELDDPTLCQQTNSDDYNKILGEMSIFMQDSDWASFQDTFG